MRDAIQNAIDSNPVKPSTEIKDLLNFCVIQELHNTTLKYTQFLQLKTTVQVYKFLAGFYFGGADNFGKFL